MNCEMRHQDRVSSQQPFAVALAMGLCAAGLGSTILAADIEVTFAGSTNVFGGREVKMPVAIESKEAFRGVLQWRLSADRRTLAAGELLAEVDAGQSVVETLVRMPEVKDGVVLEAEFSVSIGQADEFDLKQPVWIYSADPFSGRTAWLRELNLALYDPEGNTAEIFKEAKIPLRTCRTFATMRELTEGTLIIGEGVSLARHRGLSELLLSQASHGLNVICLAPKDGRFEIPDIAPISEVGADPIGPQSMSLRQTDALTELDKRFDVVRWSFSRPRRT